MTKRGAKAESQAGDDAAVESGERTGDRETSGVRVSPEQALAETADLPLSETADLAVAEEPSGPFEPKRSSLANRPLADELHADEAVPPDLLAAGTLIADRFRIGRMIGRGGHGFVYEAEHVVLGYPVAIKVLCAAYGHDARRRARFRREALLGARLRHRNVASIHDAGELEDGSPFLVMEHVDGDDLATVIARLGSLDAAATVEIGVQLLAAVTALCERGVIHRDIKPNNVMLQRSVDGYVEVKLLDFGISKAMRAELALKTLTADDCVLGTPQYMSPEQVRGEELDVRADLYSVGALLYECLTGTPPFDAETPGAVLARILTEDAPALRDVRADAPRELADLIDRAVAKRPDDRWRSPGAMAEALRAVAQRLHLPRGADAWGSLTPRPAAPADTMAFALIRPKAAGADAPSDGKAPETAAERPASKSGRMSEVREPTERVLLDRLSSMRPPSMTGRGWVALAAAVPVVLGIATATWGWGGEGASVADAAAPEGVAAKIAGARVASSSATVAERATENGGTATPTVASPPSAREREEVQAEALLAAAASTAAPSRAASSRGGSPGAVARDGRRGSVASDLERRALSAFLAGRDSEAVALYMRATQISPGRASAWRGLGLASAAHDRRTAARALRRYLELAPDAADRRSIEQRLARM